MQKVIVTGGAGFIGSNLVDRLVNDGFYVIVIDNESAECNEEFYYNDKAEYHKYDVENYDSIEPLFKGVDYVFHLAAESRIQPTLDRPVKACMTNIIGTCNVVKICEKLKIKLIYFSTGYVYPGTKGNYSETDSVNPINKYAISKLGGECAVRMYGNSLILRIIMCEKPFIHKSAFYDVKTNFIFQDDVAKMIPKLLSKKGIINIGGKTQSVYNFAKKYNRKIKKTSGKKIFPANPFMNLSKLKKILD